MFFMGNLTCSHFCLQPWINPDGWKPHCFSYSPLPRRLRTVNPAFLASLTDNGLSFTGELNVEIIFRTGFLHAGQFVNGCADSGRRKVNLPPHTEQSPSHNSYS